MKISLILLICGLGIITGFILYKVISASLGEGTYKPSQAKTSPMSGGHVQYTKDDIGYQELSEQDKVNFAFYIMKYNVHDKKELSEGIYEVKQIRRPEDLFKIQSPQVAMQRFSSIATFVGLLIAIILFVMWLFANIFGIDPIKRGILGSALLTLIALIGLSYLISWVENRTLDKLDAIQSSL